MNHGNCPQCGSNWDGGTILETFLEKRNNGEEYYRGKTDEEIKLDVLLCYSGLGFEDEITGRYGSREKYLSTLIESFDFDTLHWSRLIGVELPYNHPEHYDGVSYWHCPDCKSEWNRWTGELVKSLKMTI